MDGVKHSMPAGARGKMHQSVEDAHQALPESAIASVIGAGSVDGPIDKKRVTHNGVAVDKSPVAAVLAVVAIITHGEIFAGRNDHFISLNIFAQLGTPFVDDVQGNHLIAERGKRIVEGIIREGRIMHDVRLVQLLAVDVHLLVDELYMISRQTDDAFHVMGMIQVWIFENDDIAALQRTVRQKLFIPGAVAAEDKFVDQQMVAD